MANENLTHRRRHVLKFDEGRVQVEVKAYDLPASRGVEVVIPHNLSLDTWEARRLGVAITEAADWAELL